MRLKICGITEADEVGLLGRLSVDFVGLWHGVGGGRSDLSFKQLRCLAADALATSTLQPVLVTFIKDPGDLRLIVEETGIRWVQLHGFQTPAVVSELKRTGPADLVISKVLHLQGGRCLERPLLGAYERAGVDVFLLDTATADGRIGSTGQHLDCEAALALCDSLDRPFLLAGGLSSDSHVDFRLCLQHPGFFGIDVDSNARGADMRICARRVGLLSQHWSAAVGKEQHHGSDLH